MFWALPGITAPVTPATKPAPLSGNYRALELSINRDSFL